MSDLEPSGHEHRDCNHRHAETSPFASSTDRDLISVQTGDTAINTNDKPLSSPFFASSMHYGQLNKNQMSSQCIFLNYLCLHGDRTLLLLYLKTVFFPLFSEVEREKPFLCNTRPLNLLPIMDFVLGTRLGPSAREMSAVLFGFVVLRQVGGTYRLTRSLCSVTASPERPSK